MIHIQTLLSAKIMAQFVIVIFQYLVAVKYFWLHLDLIFCRNNKKKVCGYFSSFFSTFSVSQFFYVNVKVFQFSIHLQNLKFLVENVSFPKMLSFVLGNWVIFHVEVTPQKNCTSRVVIASQKKYLTTFRV